MYLKPRGKFTPKVPMRVIAHFSRFKPGDKVPHAPYPRLRRWWQRGWIAAEEHLTEEERELFALGAAPGGVEGEGEPAPGGVEGEGEPAPGGVEGEGEPVPDGAEGEGEPVPVSAEEGEKGWWSVTYSDGAVKKMRRSDVESLGISSG